MMETETPPGSPEPDSPADQPPRIRRILLGKPLIISVSALACYTLAGFFLAPWLVKRYAPPALERRFNARAAIGEVRINPFRLTAEIRDLRLTEKNGAPLLGLGRLFVDLEAKGILERAWTFRDVQLEAPAADVVIEKDGGIRLLKHLAPPSSPSTPQAAASAETPAPAIPRILLNRFAIQGGRIDVADMRQSTPARLALHPIDLTLTDVTTLPAREGAYTIAAGTGDGASVKGSGRLSLAPLAASGTLSVEHLRAASLWAFARDALNLAEPKGSASVALQYEIGMAETGLKAVMKDLDLRLADISLRLEPEKTPFFSAASIRLEKGRADLSRREAAVGAFSVQGGRFETGVDPDGRLRIQTILRPGKPKPKAAANVNPPAWRLEIQKMAVEDFALAFADLSRKAEPGIRAGKVSFSSKASIATGPGDPQVRLDNIAVKIQDAALGRSGSAPPMVALSSVTVGSGALDLSGRSVTAGSVETTGGSVILVRDTAGQIDLLSLFTPKQAAPAKAAAVPGPPPGKPWRLGVEKVRVQGLRSTLTDAATDPDKPAIALEEISAELLKVDGRSPSAFTLAMTVAPKARMSLRGTVDPAGPGIDAALDLRGLDLTPFQPYIEPFVDLRIESGRVSTQGTLRFGGSGAKALAAYAGKVQSEDLRLVETGSRETIAGWKSLQTGAVRIELEPNRLLIDEIALSEPAGKLFIARDGSVNIVKLIKKRNKGKAAPEKPAPPASGEAFPVRISKIRFSKGLLDFTDLSLIPPFASKIRELNGVVIGMSSAKNARAQVKLEGRVDDYGSAKIGGEINAFDPKTFTDINMVFRNVEMTRLSPYSGKFAGRRIASGKISLDLKYKIQESRLQGDNQIIVDRLVLGEKVDSPGAPNLPLDLAVALMQDGNGVIDIGLPVQGDLSDPKFSFGGLVGKALVNLITKIVTAPFKALGALLGMKEDALDAVAFEAGSTSLPPPEREKLARLVEALRQRPQLKVLVTGHYDPKADGQALQDLQVRSTLAIRRGAPLAPGEDPGPVDFSNPRVQKELEKWYVERFGSEALKALTVKTAGTVKGKAEDPGSLAKAIFAALVEKEPLAAGTLETLGAGRARAVAAALTGPAGIPPERVKQAPPEAKTGKQNALSAGLSLEAAPAEKRPAR